MRRLGLSLIATVVLLVGAAPAAAAPAGSAVATFTRVSEWPAGHVGSITITNGGVAPITGWRVAFDLAGSRITSLWGGTVTRDGDRYVVVDAGWNATIAAGASVTFGWVAEGHGTPAGCTLNGADCAGVPADRTAPSRPGPLAFDTTAGLTLTWQPSADDGGAVTYEVYESGRLIATTTADRYVYSTGPALPPRIYVFAVRAVDAAGNASMLSYRTLGTVWRGDEVPPPPTALRIDTPAPGLVRLSWTAPPPIPQINVPPVAGYRITVDGEPVGEVGGTSIVLDSPPAGPHTYAVRTVNAVDRASEPVTIVR